ncbi:ABC transporter substrate-binding protein [Paenibacillus sp.]|uniref:ABC transporter substrate-binding protein n=1 Tax=Paenibacillus sp. TaxID=58172 RepID=UPI0035671B2C
MNTKTLALPALSLLLAFGAAGCSPDMAAKQTGSGFTPLGKEETAKIKVLFYNDQAFNMLYGSAFSVKHPNIEVEVVSMMPLMMSGNPSKEAFDQLIKEQKPDVLFLNAEQYQRLSGDGRLLQLDPIVKQTGFDIENLHPTVVELLKSKGNGSLYGLAPSFGGRALFYNKDLFDRYGVAYPTDQMTWDEVLQLAKRFPTDQQGDQRIYGYASSGYGMGPASGYFELVYDIGLTQGLQMIHPDDKTIVNMKSEGWKKTLQSAVDAYKSGSVRPPAKPSFDENKPETIYTQNPFMAGKAAMTLGGYYMITSMEQAAQNVKSLKPVQWEAVTEPVDPANPDQSSSFYINQIVSISEDSDAQSAAWELVEYINSDELAKTLSKSAFELLSRPAYMKEKNGRSLESFYKLKPSDKNTGDFTGVPISFYAAFDKAANQEIEALMQNKISVDQALQNIEQLAQQELIKARAAQPEDNSAQQPSTSP